MSRVPSSEASFIASLDIEQSGVRLVPGFDDSGHRRLSVYIDNGSGGRLLVKHYRNRANAVSVANLLAGAQRIKDRKGGKSGR